MSLSDNKKQNSEQVEKILIAGEKPLTAIGPAKSEIFLGGKKQKVSVKRFALGAVIGILLILILSSIIFGFGIYRFGWENDVVYKITKVIPYPVAFVNWRPVRFSEYAEDIKALKIFFERQQNNLGAETPEDKELKENVLNRLINNELVYQLGKKYNIKISDNDLEAEVQKIIEQDESREKVEETLKEQYGWQISQFKIKILKPFLFQQKLQEAISKDEGLNREAKQKAEEVFAKLKNGENFEELAKEYSEDSTASLGGDLGYFGKGVMVPEFENAAFALDVGEVSDLVLTKYGYHIIKVEEKIKNDMGEVEQVRARHILIRTKDLDKVLDEERGRVKIWRLIKI